MRAMLTSAARAYQQKFSAFGRQHGNCANTDSVYCTHGRYSRNMCRLPCPNRRRPPCEGPVTLERTEQTGANEVHFWQPRDFVGAPDAGIGPRRYAKGVQINDDAYLTQQELVGKKLRRNSADYS